MSEPKPKPAEKKDLVLERKRIAIDLWQGHRDFTWAQFRAIIVVQIAFFAGFWATVRDVPIMASVILIVGAVIMFATRLLLGRHFETNAAFRTAAGDLFPTVPPARQRSDTVAKWLVHFLILINCLVALSSFAVSSALNDQLTIPPIGVSEAA